MARQQGDEDLRGVRHERLPAADLRHADHEVRRDQGVICRSSCATREQLILWWMGEEMHDEMTLGDALGWRAVVETTLHCEDREQRADRGLKRSRSSRSPCRGVDLCSVLHPSSK